MSVLLLINMPWGIRLQMLPSIQMLHQLDVIKIFKLIRLSLLEVIVVNESFPHEKQVPINVK